MQLLREFLHKNEVMYTQGGLMYLLQMAGSSWKALEAGGQIKPADILYAMERVPNVPLHVTLLGSGPPPRRQQQQQQEPRQGLAQQGLGPQSGMSQEDPGARKEKPKRPMMRRQQTVAF